MGSLSAREEVWYVKEGPWSTLAFNVSNLGQVSLLYSILSGTNSNKHIGKLLLSYGKEREKETNWIFAMAHYDKARREFHTSIFHGGACHPSFLRAFNAKVRERGNWHANSLSVRSYLLLPR